MFAGIGLCLGHKKAVVRLNLLRLVRIILDACDPDVSGSGSPVNALGSRQVRSLLDTIRVLAEKDSAVLVRNLAAELVKLRVGGAALDAASAPNTSRRPGSGGRRTYTPPSPHVALAVPHTPTQGGRYRHSRGLSSGAAYIEVAASPRRTPAVDRDGAVYRPRSSDSTGIPRRVSGEPGTPGSGGSREALARSRLPRTALSYARGPMPGQAPPVVNRSESALSNKENAGRGPGLGPGSGAGVGSPAAGMVAGKRRSRAPSDAKW